MQLQCRKMNNGEEEGNRHFGDAPETEGSKVEWMYTYNISERVFQFGAKTIPIKRIPNRIPIIRAMKREKF